MYYRILFAAITGLFVTMNVLLWRSELVSRGRLGALVPTRVVWDKVLTSPDNSFLEIRHHGKRIGRGNWVASIGEALADEGEASRNLPPEGMVKRVTGYRLDFDGSLALEEAPRARFYVSLKLDTNQNWKELDVRVNMRPLLWEFEAFSDTQQVRLLTEDEEGRREQRYTFAELRQPEIILRELGVPTVPGMLGFLGLSWPASSTPTNSPVNLSLPWEARLDRLLVGHTSVRVYRLQAELFARYKVALLVSPVGEILRVELPDEIVLSNEGVANF